MLAWFLSLLLPFLLSGGEAATPVIMPAHNVTADSEESEWAEFHTLSYTEHVEAFTALFNGYETRWAKNGRLMLRNGDSGPYKFVKRTA